MTDVDETAVENLAKQRWEQDGFVTELTYKPEPNRPQRLLNEEQRQQYLAKARAELIQEEHSKV